MEEKMIRVKTVKFDFAGMVKPIGWCLIFTFIGFMLSIEFDDFTMMARMGSVIVIYGVYLTWEDISKSHIDRKKVVDAWLGNKKNDLSSKLEKEIARLRAVDVVVISYGTFVWGWGDLLLKIIMASP
ncbi:MAG: hypothetical protein ACI82Q_003145 [Nonlabens sp.]|jgi:hypothetical protein